jgi:hypothetical protein
VIEVTLGGRRGALLGRAGAQFLGRAGVQFLGRAGVQFLAAARALGAAIEREVDEDPPRVRDRVVHPADLRPAPRHLEQRLLDEVLGLGQVPDDQVRGPQQAVGAVGYEAVEVWGGAGHLTGLTGAGREKVESPRGSVMKVVEIVIDFHHAPPWGGLPGRSR